MAEDIIEVKDSTVAKTKEDNTTKMVRNVLKKLIEEIGISIDETPIILDVTSAINKTIKPEDQINPDKERKFHQILFYYCIGYLLILIQTSIPSIKTRRTFPTCVRSFSGYPLESDTDMSGIEYLCCVAIGLKSAIKPWNIFKGKINPKMLAKQIKVPLG